MEINHPSTHTNQVPCSSNYLDGPIKSSSVCFRLSTRREWRCMASSSSSSSEEEAMTPPMAIGSATHRN